MLGICYTNSSVSYIDLASSALTFGIHSQHELLVSEVSMSAATDVLVDRTEDDWREQSVKGLASRVS